MVNNEKKLKFWSISTSDMLKKLQTTTDGLKNSEVGERLKRYGANILKPKNEPTPSHSCWPNSGVQLLLSSSLHLDFLFSLVTSRIL